MRSFAGWLIALFVVISSAPSAQAQSKPTDTGKTVIAVVGDSLADGLWAGLYKLLQKDKRFALIRSAKHSVGFTGSDLTDFLDKSFATGDVHAVVMMIGVNDRRSFFVDGKARALLGTPGWIELYRGRVTNFIEHVGRRNVPLIWILLPVMRDETATRDAGLVNEIVRAASKDYAHVSLVDTNSFSADENGSYQSHFNDLNGQKRQMRSSDGVHFEQSGSELIGDLVMKRLRDVSPRFQALAPQ